ncbi:MAG: hypothetical protein QOH46_1678 [Solirubrobacteraceae bacterium]|nr:hypothetical protein [Solirubrobacteraceae bacterium]
MPPANVSRGIEGWRARGGRRGQWCERAVAMPLANLNRGIEGWRAGGCGYLT